MSVALGHHLLIVSVDLTGLPKGEEVFLFPIADEALGDGGSVGFDAMIAEGREFGPVAFASENGIHDGETGLASDIANDISELDVHLGERLLHMLNVTGGVANECIPMTPETAYGTDLGRWAEGGAKQANGVEVLQPLATPAAWEAAG